MSPTARSRAIAILGLVALSVALGVWYGSLGPAPDLGAYPGSDELATDYERYLGERVDLEGRVVDADPVTIVAGTDAGPPVRLTVTDLSIATTEGETLRVYGVAAPDHTIRAQNAFTVPRRGQWYAWTVSFLAGLWVLGRLCRYWRIETTAWTVVPRATPLLAGLGERLRTALHREDR